jgi:hypothetical protein
MAPARFLRSRLVSQDHSLHLILLHKPTGLCQVHSENSRYFISMKLDPISDPKNLNLNIVLAPQTIFRRTGPMGRLPDSERLVDSIHRVRIEARLEFREEFWRHACDVRSIGHRQQHLSPAGIEGHL